MVELTEKRSFQFTVEFVKYSKMNIFLLFYSLPITILYTPKMTKEVNFNLLCHVKKKSQQLHLNVKGEGYSMKPVLMCEDSTGNKVELNHKSLNIINFGEVSLCGNKLMIERKLKK